MGHSVGRRIILGLICAMAVMTGPAYAAGEGLGWSSPDFLSPDGVEARAPSLSVMTDGTAVAGWAQQSGGGGGWVPVIASRPVAANWTAPSPLVAGNATIDGPATFSFGPRLAVTHDGHFIDTWLAGGNVGAATGTLSPGSPPGFTPHTIVTSTSIPGRTLSLTRTPQVFMTPDGKGVIAYPFSDDLHGEYEGLTGISGAQPTNADAKPQTSIASYIQLGGTNTDDSGSIPPVAAAPPTANGLSAANDTIAMVATSPSYNTTINGQQVPAESGLLYTTTNPSSWPSNFTLLPMKGFGAAVGVLPNGQAIVTSTSDTNQLLLWRGGPGTTVIDPNIGESVTRATIAVAPDGSVLIAYQALDPTGSYLEIRQVTISATGAVSQPQTLSAADANAGQARIAFAPDGTTYVIWYQADTSGSNALATGVFAPVRLPDGSFPATPQTVYGGTVDAAAPPPLIAVGPDGFVTAVAQITVAAGQHRIAAFTHANPAAPKNVTPPVITAPNGLTAGKPLSCSRGTWTANPTSFLFEWLVDGASLGPGAVGSTHTITAGEIGHRIACRVTASNQAGSGRASSAAVTPAAASPGAPRVSTIKTNDNTLTVNATCPVGGGSCPITLQLTVSAPSHHASDAAKRRAAKTTLIGKLSATLKAGSKRTLKLGLNATGRKLLAKRHRITAVLQILSGKRQIKRKTVTLKQPPRRKKRH